MLYHRGRAHSAMAKEIRRKELTSMTKETLDIGDENEKEKLEELRTTFEQLTEWLKGILGDILKSTSKKLMDTGDESRVRTLGQVAE